MAPTGRFTVSEIDPVPLGEHDAPLDAAQVHVAPLRTAGNESVTVAPLTDDGPTFVATIVYVTLWPGTAVDEPSVFVIVRSAVRLSESTSVAELFVVSGSVDVADAATVAVLESEPVAPAAIAAVNV